MSAAIADEVHGIVTSAAMPVRPGESVKAQMNRSWANLGRPPFWRIRAAWYRDGSGSWSASTVRDLHERHALWRQQERTLAAPEQQGGVGTAADVGSTVVQRLDAIRAGLMEVQRQVSELAAEVERLPNA